MDGMFVPNITLGPMVVSAIRAATTLPLDVHLQIADPRRYLGLFRDAGADSMTIHLEADTHPHRTLAQIRELGARAGLAINPGTPVAHASELVDSIDLLLVMSVNPGFGSQPFIDAALRKLSEAREMVHGRCEIEVDGGVKLTNARAVADAGATVVVAGSFVYLEGDDPAANVRALRSALDD